MTTAIRTIRAGAAALGAGLLFAAGGALAQDIPPVEVTVIGNLGITTQSKTLEAPFWTGGVTEASNGAITAQFKPFNEMGLKGPEIFRLLGQGVTNIATGQFGHHAGDAPINDATDLAGLSTSMQEFRTVTDAFRPVISKFYEDQLGLKILTMQSYQSQILYCREPIAGLKDLAGKRIRTSGASQADFVGYFGGTGVNMAFGEVQQALQQGVIDCAITGTLGGYVAGWHQGARYLYTLPINFGAGATVANLGWWNGLPEVTQTFLQEQLTALSEKMWALNMEEDQMGIACNTSGPCPLGEPAGMTRVDPSPEDIALRATAMREVVLPGFAKRCGPECVAAFNDTIGKATGLTITQ